MEATCRTTEQINRIEGIFDTLIKKGHIEKEAEVIPGITVKMRVITSAEEARALRLLASQYPEIAPLGWVTHTMVAAFAITEINSIEIDTSVGEDVVRAKIFDMLQELSTAQRRKFVDMYVSLTDEQNNAYLTLNEDIKNF